MVETYTKRAGAVKQEYGSNPEAWGGELNEAALQRLDDMWGTTEVVVSGTVTLTASDKIANQARQVCQILTGTGGTLIVPDKDKLYLIVNGCTGDVLVRPGIAGTGATVRAGTQVIVYINAAGSVAFAIDMPLSMFKPPVASLAMNGQKITGLAQGAPSSSEAPTVQQVSDMIANAGALSGLPPAIGNALRFLQVNSGATATQWAIVTLNSVLPMVYTTGSVTAAPDTMIWGATAGGAFNVTLPIAPLAGETVIVVRDGANSVTVLRNGNNIAELAEDHTLDVDKIMVVFKYVNGGWRIISVTGIA